MQLKTVRTGVRAAGGWGSLGITRCCGTKGDSQGLLIQGWELICSFQE